MYSNILYFITVLLIFSLYNPPESGMLSWYADVTGIATLCILFLLYIRRTFSLFAKRYGYNSTPASAFATIHASLVQRGIVLAIIMYALFVYICELKSLILLIPGLKTTVSITNLLGIIPFFGLLLIVWRCAYNSYRRFYHPDMSLRAYLSSHIRLNSMVVLPWLLVSVLLDVISLLFSDFYNTIEQYPLASFGFFGIFLVITAFYFPYVMIRLWGCKPVPYGPLRERLEEFCRKAHFEYADILLWNLFDGKLVTAGVVGFLKRFRYILISPILLQMLDEEEIESVIAHEIGHVKNRHLFYYFIFLMGYVVIGYNIFDILSYEILSSDIFLNLIVSGNESSNTIISIMLTLLPLGFFLIYFRFIFGYYSRNFERQSDLYALKLKGKSDGIVNSLEKIARISSINKYAPNWHHFGIFERVQFLEQCQADPSLINKHDRKVSAMVVIFMLVLVGLSSFLYGSTVQQLNQSKIAFIQKLFERQVQKHPENPLYNFSLGNIYYEKGDLKQAEIYYKTALILNPEDPEVLNNLAWLYATSKIAELRKPREALALAQKAAQLDPKPHILDTLGESYFINGFYEEAVRAIEQAISEKPENLQYYKDQLNKFKKYLDKENDQKQPFDEDLQRYAI